MNDLCVMRGQLLRRVLPFMLALLAGIGAFWLVRREPQCDCVTPREAQAMRAAQMAAAKTEPRELPELRVLSPMMMEEVRVFQLQGGGYENPQIKSPAGPHYTAAKPQSYRQGVLHLNFLFGADGRVSEITPLVKRHDCSLCLQGPNVVGIDPRDPRWNEQVEAAKDAVRRIEFVPGTNGGRPVGMHGLAECVFRLD